MDRAGTEPSIVTSEERLVELYGAVNPNALIKEIDHVSDHYRAFIEASPFVVVATVGPEGLDCSPRGDPAGFVRLVDPRTLLIPDRLGNNRIDTLRNIVRDGRISLLFLIPGIGETLRVNGTAEIDVDPELLASFAMNGKAPRSVVRIRTSSVYFQCQKALVRSGLWKAETRIERSALPSTGSMLEALSAGTFDGGAYDTAYPERLKATIY